jgi:hypothetical protein
MWSKGRKIGCWFVAVGTLAFAFAWARYVNLPLTQPQVVELPAIEEIQSVTGALEEGSQFGVVPEFPIPPEYVPRILAALTPAHRHDYAASRDDPPLGRLEIVTRTGQRIRVRFGYSGKNPLCFTIDGVRCIRGGRYKPVQVAPTRDEDVYTAECIDLECALWEIYWEQKSGKKREYLNQRLDDLERSAGQRAPERRGPSR